jgi:ABC-type antimicrobial peptide transport system permease subunit
LDAYNAVQNTYLNTFQILGGLGLLLGTAGLGVVVLRNVLERRAELALFTAVGLRARVLRKLVVMEHGALLFAGLLIGIVAALVAIVPALRGPMQQVNYRGLSITLAVVCVSGLIWTWVAARIALRGELLKALRNE